MSTWQFSTFDKVKIIWEHDIVVKIDKTDFFPWRRLRLKESHYFNGSILMGQSHQQQRKDETSFCVHPRIFHKNQTENNFWDI